MHLSDLYAPQVAQILQFEQSIVTVKSLHSSNVVVGNQTILFDQCARSDGKEAVQVLNCSFLGGQGRAIYLANSSALISNGVFDSLTSLQGSAVWANNSDGSRIAIANCTFINNTAARPDSDSNDDWIGFGGALFLQSANSSIAESAFFNNSAVEEGGAVYLYSLSFEQPGNWPNESHTINKCTFSYNTAGLRGGPLYMLGSIGTGTEKIQLLDSYFSDTPLSYPMQYTGDGVTFWGVVTVFIDGCTFVRSTNMYVYGHTKRVTSLFLVNTVFSDNFGGYNMTDDLSDRKGDINDAGECGGVQCSYCQCVGVYNTSFLNNTGAGLCVRGSQGNCEIKGQANVYPPLFNRSTIAGDEGSQWIINNTNTDPLTSTSLDIRASKFSNNVAPGVLRAAADQSLRQATAQSAGALDMVDVHRSIIADTIFISNRGEQGGAIHMDACSISIMWNISFLNNSAIHEGGALAFIENQHTDGIFMGAITARNNSARAGGALYGDAGAGLTITNDTIMEFNSAEATGGALHCLNCQLILMQLGVVMGYNQALGSGGAMYLDNCDGFTAQGIQVHDNRSASVAGVLVSICQQHSSAAFVSSICQQHMTYNMILYCTACKLPVRTPTHVLIVMLLHHSCPTNADKHRSLQLTCKSF